MEITREELVRAADCALHLDEITIEEYEIIVTTLGFYKKNESVFSHIEEFNCLIDN